MIVLPIGDCKDKNSIAILRWLLELDYWLFSNDMPKRTYKPNKRRRVKRHGFRARMASKDGIKVLSRRRAKGRAKIAVTKSRA